MAPMLTIADLKERHRQRVPKMFYDYVDSGSYTEGTYRSNESAFGAIKLRQRVARDIDNRDLSGTVLGKPTTLPLTLAPVGLTGMQYPDG
ncbi:MAG: alpha-hydroxy-acid oxidizing protein, partial [Pseudomonadota bacterium]